MLWVLAMFYGLLELWFIMWLIVLLPVLLWWLWVHFTVKSRFLYIRILFHLMKWMAHNTRKNITIFYTEFLATTEIWHYGDGLSVLSMFTWSKISSNVGLFSGCSFQHCFISWIHSMGAWSGDTMGRHIGGGFRIFWTISIWSRCIKDLDTVKLL